MPTRRLIVVTSYSQENNTNKVFGKEGRCCHKIFLQQICHGVQATSTFSLLTSYMIFLHSGQSFHKLDHKSGNENSKITIFFGAKKLAET